MGPSGGFVATRSGQRMSLKGRLRLPIARRWPAGLLRGADCRTRMAAMVRTADQRVRPLAGSARPIAVVRVGRVNDSTRLAAAVRIWRTNVGGCPKQPVRVFRAAVRSTPKLDV